MTEHIEVSPDATLPTPVVVRRDRSWNLPRGLAGIGGGILLLGVSVVTVGIALLAPVGMIVARAIARREKTSLTFGTSWLGAAFGVCFALIIIVLVLVARLPTGTIEKFGKTADSLSTASNKAPPPTWVDRISPGATARARASQKNQNATLTRGFTIAFTVFGAVFVYSLLSMLIGTAGWAPSLLLTYAFTGRWLPDGRST